ncbi:MAG: HEPN domain-containing protein [Desulfobacteraceae bacterium]|nr:MAG: HEPN domain-containing protein [Desulfobacteraceae bacterium]
MGKEPEQWFKQAQYDLSTAEAMFDAKKYIYVIFMCHLAIEKALKGLYSKKFGNIPPKVHNLLFLLEKIGVSLPSPLSETVFELNRASIPTRYPEDLQQMKKDYPRQKSEQLLVQSKEVLKWLKKELRK